MKEHKKHKHHPHDKKAAMTHFNEGHWEHHPEPIDTAGGRYSSEFNQSEEYRKSVDALSDYVKTHRMKY